jgi:hypothetical protein
VFGCQCIGTCSLLQTCEGLHSKCNREPGSVDRSIGKDQRQSMQSYNLQEDLDMRI